MEISERACTKGEIDGRVVRVTSWRLGTRFAAEVDDDGRILGRGRGADRLEAESNARFSAAIRLEAAAARASLKRSIERLPLH
jgi:hypothetical protein